MAWTVDVPPGSPLEPIQAANALRKEAKQLLLRLGSVEDDFIRRQAARMAFNLVQRAIQMESIPEAGQDRPALAGSDGRETR